MVKRLIWSNRALQEKDSILTYWFERNKTKTYSKKLAHQFNQSIQQYWKRNYAKKNSSFGFWELFIILQNYGK